MIVSSKSHRQMADELKHEIQAIVMPVIKNYLEKKGILLTLWTLTMGMTGTLRLLASTDATSQIYGDRVQNGAVLRSGPTVRHYTMMDGLISNTVRSIMQDSLGYLWFGTTNGFSRYDGYTFISFPDSVAHAGHYLQNMVAQTPDGYCWEAVYGEGVHVTNPASKIDTYIKAGVNSPLVSNNIKAIYADRSGSLWIGYEFYGLSQILPAENLVFQYHSLNHAGKAEDNFVRMVCSTASDDGERIWIGNRNYTLFQMDDDGRAVEKAQLVSHPYCILTQGEELLIGTREGGIVSWRDEVGANGVEKHFEEDPESLADNHVYSMHRDREGHIWVGTFGGGLDLRIAPGKYRHYLQGDVDTRHVRDIAEDAKGRIWVSTGAGLYMCQPQADSIVFTRYNQENGALPGYKTRTLYIDDEQRLYVSIAGEGFVTADLNEAEIHFVQWKPLAGMGALPIVQTFVEDKQGMIWVGTEHGLARFDPHTGNFRNYYPSGDLGGNVIEEQTGLSLPDGRIMMGTHQGVMIFDPMAIDHAETAPTPYLTDLSQSEGNVKMTFSTFDYAARYPHRYRYRLSGYDKGWSDPSVHNVAEYKHLSPGTYQLEVQAISAAGIEGEVRSFEFSIACPWYRTWWAYLTYLLLVGFLLSYFVRNEQEKRRLRKRLMLDDQVKKQEPDATVLNPEDQAYRQRLDQVIEEQLSNEDFSVEDFAARMNLGRTLFFHRTKEVTGYSPKEYLRICRMQRAAQLLVTSAMNVAEVAYSVGMTDPLYFSKCFKNHFGVAPSRYCKGENCTE